MSLRKDEQADYKLSSLRSFYSIKQALSRTAEVKEIWMVEKGGHLDKTYHGNIDTYNIFAFKDFVEIVDMLTPDLVMGFGGAYEYLERSMIKAAAFRGIPNVTVLGSFIESWVASTSIEGKIISGRLHALRDHGRDILKKYLFMLRTLSRIGFDPLHLFKIIIKDIYVPLVSFSPIYTFGGADLNIINTPEWAELVVKKGIERRKIVITGDCTMDSVYQKLNSNNGQASKHQKVEVLFVTTPMVEHGHWSPRMRKEVVTKVVAGLLNHLRDKINLRVKIHPNTERLEDYRKLLDPIDKNIEVIQSEDLFLLLQESDVIVSFGPTSAIFQAILLGKPVYLMNLFNEDTRKNIYLREKIALECKTVDSLIEKIRDYKNHNIDGSTITAFIEKTFYKFDGKSSERAANSILALLQDRNIPVK